jgi:hypothetical protein
MDREILELSHEVAEPNLSPFLKYEVITLNDQATAGNYSSGQCVFETVTLSNNGRWCDYNHGAYFSIPCVFVVTGTTPAVPPNDPDPIDWTANNVKDSDLLIGFKNSNVNLINSIAIDYGNKQCTQASDFVNQYLTFKQHETMSEQDELLNGPTIGYSKDSSDSWTYKNVANQGLFNNMNGVNNTSSVVNVNMCNTGMRKRQEVFRRVNASSQSQENLFGANLDEIVTNLKASGENFVVNYDTHKVYYYNAIVRLKDLPVFPKCGLMKGANWRITMTLNQCIFKVTKDGGGLMKFVQTNYNGRNTNFLMVADNKQFFRAEDVDTAATTIVTESIGGAYPLVVGTELTISCSVGKCNFAQHAGLNVSAHESNVKLHVPTIVLNYAEDSRLLAKPQRTVIYDEVLTFIRPNKIGMFDELVTNGIAHVKRMIMCPVLSAAGNQNINPHVSPFSTEPSTCSPYKIQNFQVQLANHNIYMNNINYSYESFLTEMNGKYSIGHNLAKGIAGSRISLKDYINTYGYIVVDLKRKPQADEATPLSIQISGRIVSPKPLDFYIFVEQEKSFTYDTATGARLD